MTHRASLGNIGDLAVDSFCLKLNAFLTSIRSLFGLKSTKSMAELNAFEGHLQYSVYDFLTWVAPVCFHEATLKQVAFIIGKIHLYNFLIIVYDSLFL